MKARTELEWFYYPSILKNGKEGKRWHSGAAEYSPLHNCCVCGKLGGLRHVSYCYDFLFTIYRRHDGGFDFGSIPFLDNPHVCKKCFFKLMPTYRLKLDQLETYNQIKQIEKGMRKWKRLQQKNCG